MIRTLLKFRCFGAAASLFFSFAIISCSCPPVLVILVFPFDKRSKLDSLNSRCLLLLLREEDAHTEDEGETRRKKCRKSVTCSEVSFLLKDF